MYDNQSKQSIIKSHMSGFHQNPFILHELILQIPLFRNYEICDINSCKINGSWWEPDICDFIIDWFSCHAWLFLSCPMTCLKLLFNYALTPFCDSALSFANQVRIRFHFDYSLCIFWYSCVHDWFEYSLFS